MFLPLARIKLFKDISYSSDNQLIPFILCEVTAMSLSIHVTTIDISLSNQFFM